MRAKEREGEIDEERRERRKVGQTERNWCILYVRGRKWFESSELGIRIRVQMQIQMRIARTRARFARSKFKDLLNNAAYAQSVHVLAKANDVRWEGRTDGTTKFLGKT